MARGIRINMFPPIFCKQVDPLTKLYATVRQHNSVKISKFGVHVRFSLHFLGGQLADLDADGRVAQDAQLEARNYVPLGEEAASGIEVDETCEGATALVEVINNYTIFHIL